MDLIKRKQNNILLHKVNIGEKTVSIPVTRLGSGKGKRVLITGGVDGDEYTGIEAAYALIKQYSKIKFDGELSIIPIVNIPGFEGAVSWNPIDNKYPKHIFPGKEKGSSTERLMYWLSSNFVKDIDLWIDLHSGASTEVLDPYVGAYETKNKQLNEMIRSYLLKVKAERINFDAYTPIFAENIAKRKVAKIVLESGQLGQRNKKDIKQHIDWVKQLLSDKKLPKIVKKNVYKNVREFLATQNGIWIPSLQSNRVQKGKVLGEVRSLDGKILQKITAYEAGVFLWRREAMSCKKGDSLYAYAHQKESFMSC